MVTDPILKNRGLAHGECHTTKTVTLLSVSVHNQFFKKYVLKNDGRTCSILHAHLRGLISALCCRPWFYCKNNPLVYSKFSTQSALCRASETL